MKTTSLSGFGKKTINLSILDFKSVSTDLLQHLTKTINLSILDFKSCDKFVKQNIIKTINLSILNFKCQFLTANPNNYTL